MAKEFRVNTLNLSGKKVTASNVITTGETGAFYPFYGNPAGFVTAAQAGGVTSLGVTGKYVSGVLDFTGIGGLVVLISGNNTIVFSGGAGTIGDTGQFITTAQTGQFAPSGMTGQFITTAQTGGFGGGTIPALSVTGQNIIGTIPFTGVSGISVTISGVNTIFLSTYSITSATGQFITTAQTGQFAPSGMTGQFVTTAQTGHVHSQYLTSSQAVTGLSVTGYPFVGQVILTGVGNVAVTTGGPNTIFVSGVTGNLVFQGMTGQFAPIAQTGHIHSQYALAAETGQFISTAQTGQFAPSGMTGQFVTTAQTGHIHSQYLTSTQAVTGISVTGFPYVGQVIITGVGNVVVTTGGPNTIWVSGVTGNLVFQGVTGQFIDTSKTGQFAPSGMTGQFITTAQTGQFAPSGMTGQFITTAQTGLVPELLLVVTGQVLSGNVPVTGISGVNIYTSGTQLVFSTYNITSTTGQFITTAQTGIFYPTSNPAGYITSAQAGGVSNITVTGASISGNVNLTGIRGLNVSLSGQYVLISGGDTGQFVSTAQTGVLVSRGETGNAFYPRFGNPAGYLTSAPGGGGGVTGLSVTGSIPITGLVNFTGSSGVSAVISGQTVVFDITPSSLLTISGIGGVQVIESGSFLLVSGGASAPAAGGGGVNTLIVTGSPLSGNITFSGAGGISIRTGDAGLNVIAISGWETGQYVTTAMTGQFAPSGMTGQFITTAQTGQFAPSGMTGQFITTAQTGQFAPAAQMVTQAMTGMVPELLLVATGQVLSGNVPVTGISGVNIYTSGTQLVFSTYNITSTTGQFVTTAQTGQFAPSGLTGQFITTAQTGQYLTTNYSGTVNFAQGVFVSGQPVLIGSRIITKAAVFANPDGIYSGVYTVAAWRCTETCVITGFRAWRYGGSGCFINAYKNSQAVPHGVSNMNINVTGAWVSSGSLLNNIYTIGDTLILAITSISGLPTAVTIQADLLD